MKIESIILDDSTELHIARHGVEPYEVEEVSFDSKPFVFKSRKNRYIALGRTGNGRYLTIIFEYLGQNKAKIITARAMSESERKLYKRR